MTLLKSDEHNVAVSSTAVYWPVDDMRKSVSRMYEILLQISHRSDTIHLN